MTRVPDRHESTRPTSGIQPAIEISDVTLELGGRRILDKVRFTVEAGEFVGVLGPNGAGKTTLMRALLGLVRVREGSGRVIRTPVSRGNPAIGYMPQLRGTLATRRLSGRDFVNCAAHEHRWGMSLLHRRDTRREVDQAL